MLLVSGGSGFLGGRLVQYLSAQGLQVRALYHQRQPGPEWLALPGVEWMQCDLLDVYAVETALEGITDVYHCAAIVSFDARREDEMLHFNPESTANLVNEALAHGIRKLVHVSSVAALGRPGNDGKEINEEEEWGESRYNSAYAVSKYLAEMEVWRSMGEGLNAVIANPGIILGPGDWSRGSAQLMTIAHREFPFYTNGVTSWVDVDDVVKALVMLMNADVEAERFIISGGNFSFREVFTLMATALHKRPPRYYAGPLVTALAWRLGRLKSAVTGAGRVITRAAAVNAHAQYRYSNRKLQEAFPAFLYTPIAQTIEQMARSFTISCKN